jgi:hypothetical protein
MAGESDLQIPRAVHFFRLDAGRKDNKPVPINIDAIIGEIDDIPHGPKQYLDYNDDRLFVLVDRRASGQRLRVVRTRQTDIPQRELDAQLAGLTLREGEGLAEVTHAVFLPDRHVGVEFNFHGPRASALAYYLEQRATSCPSSLRARPLLRHDVMQALDRAGELKLVDIRARRSYINTLDAVDPSLGNAFRSAAELGGAEELELVLRTALHSRGGQLAPRLKQILSDLLKKGDVTEGVDRLKVETVGMPGHPSETIDLLQGKVIFETTMLRVDLKTRAVVSDSAYKAIDQAWLRHAEEFRSATMV